ncbi:transcription termination factor 3, mitochondrial isoform X2 [Ischnura elegans]|nr:transcription termination factor 3, mitochondrial isoform X2 [Ischnura elegans]XP_046401520.1 transcription termination factor 3, mitochondrial isoform X2 [Ischnura elegans]XP_046401521.1 transcription termination factor 3, mitochondrial isoform X2 [Ischnura elegans]
MLKALRVILSRSSTTCVRITQRRLLVSTKIDTKDVAEPPNSSPACIGEDIDAGIENRESDSSLLSPNGTIELETYAPYYVPSFNFAAYVNKSSTLQELVKLGVNLYDWEKRKGIPNYVLKLDFDRDIKKVIRFLHDLGVPAEKLGFFITKNPLIFKENIEDLQVRVNYLESKNFSNEMIQRVITANPFWLMFSTARIDRRLGHFQNTFQLTGEDVRALCTKQPRLITFNMNSIQEVTFAVKELMGYEVLEMKALLLKSPILWMMNKDVLMARFNYIYGEMGVSQDLILQNPGILRSRLFRIKQRHEFLQKCCPKVPDGKSRYDPKSLGYVSLDALASGSDAEFCINVAKVSIETFNAFLKSL